MAFRCRFTPRTLITLKHTSRRFESLMTIISGELGHIIALLRAQAIIPSEAAHFAPKKI